MIVEHILADKGSHVVTIEPSRTLADAAQLLSEKRIGAVVVSDAQSPALGILSERDITRALGQRGPAALNEPVSEHMTAKLFTCTRRCSVTDLMEVMTEQRVRHVPVVEHGRLHGIISIGDVVKNRVSEMEAEQRAMDEYSSGVSTPGGRF
jgi:CBS domain-containing protein